MGLIGNRGGGAADASCGLTLDSATRAFNIIVEPVPMSPVAGSALPPQLQRFVATKKTVGLGEWCAQPSCDFRITLGGVGPEHLASISGLESPKENLIFL